MAKFQVGDRVRFVENRCYDNPVALQLAQDGTICTVVNADENYFNVSVQGTGAFFNSRATGVVVIDPPAPADPEYAERIQLNTKAESGGVKHDGGKAPWSLLMRGCAEGLAGVVAVLKFGASKYAADSWQKVENAEERYKDALYRHLHSIERNGFMSKDPETGLLEWFHVACNALFLATFAAFKARAAAEKETH